jgi:hypothetical protein
MLVRDGSSVGGGAGGVGTLVRKKEKSVAAALKIESLAGPFETGVAVALLKEA